MREEADYSLEHRPLREGAEPKFSRAARYRRKKKKRPADTERASFKDSQLLKKKNQTVTHLMVMFNVAFVHDHQGHGSFSPGRESCY